MRAHATWAVGNIAGHSPECRDYLLGLSVIPTLINVINMPSLPIWVVLAGFILTMKLLPQQRKDKLADVLDPEKQSHK